MTNYNHADFIGNAVESVIRQTNGNWELVILDDASTDNSIDLINRYTKDKRIRLYRNKINQGYVKNLIKLVSLAGAPIVGIVDSDDALAESAVERVLAAYDKNPQIGLIYTQNYICRADLTLDRLGYSGPIPKGLSNLHCNSINHFRTFRKSAYFNTSGYDSAMINGEDVDLLYKLEEVTDILYIDEPLYYYRVLAKSQTHSFFKETENRAFTALAKLCAYKRRLGTDIPNLTKIELAEVLFFGIFTSLLAKRFKLTAGFIRELFKVQPLFFLQPKFYLLIYRKTGKILKLKVGSKKAM